MWRVLKTDTDFKRDLKLSDLPFFDLAPGLQNLKPVNLTGRPRHLANAISDGIVRTYAGGSDNFEELVGGAHRWDSKVWLS